MVNMNRLPLAKRAQILGLMVEGMSIRAISRVTGASKNTIVKLLAEVGEACSKYQDETLRNLPCKRLQVDEIWSFVAMKERQVPAELKGTPGLGDTWTWTAIDADTKLVPSWLVADRSPTAARIFLRDLQSRLSSRVQITTDGLKTYIQAVAQEMPEADYAMLVKLYGDSATDEQKKSSQRRYSPAECIGTEKKVIFGKPDPAHISTSFAERQNLTMRMSMRRFTRLTNAFSKKVENHIHAISLYFMHYNFARIHQTLRVTPAMEARVSDHVWSLEEIAAKAD
jgi:IS1 family transposase